jgi:hypothetical protein
MVTFLDGNVSLGSGTISNGKASLAISTLATGTHAITASYAGDGTFLSSIGSLSDDPQTVLKASTTTNLTSSGNPALVGNSVIFTAHISAAYGASQTGTVDFYVDGSPVASGRPITAGMATFTTPSLAAGMHAITAVCNGDVNYLASTSPAFTQVINNSEDTGTISGLTVTIAPLRPGQAATTALWKQHATLTAIITPSPGSSGTVTFTDGETVFGSPTVSSDGTATLNVSQFSGIGQHTIQAIYSGGGGFQGSLSAPVIVYRSPRPR